MIRSAISGAVAALVICAVAVGALVWYRAASPQAAFDAASDSVVLMFTSQSADGATQAALITVVGDGRFRDVSADTTVVIPGATYKKLRDAYAFGGAKDVATTVGQTRGTPSMRYVAVPQSVWLPALQSGTPSVTVSVSRAISVFGPTGLTSLKSGEQTMTARQIAGLVGALPYLGQSDADVLRLQLDQALISAVASPPVDPAKLESDLKGEALRTWLSQTLARVRPE
jgi:anionic cell wall polymer biosynthesis LytR-Cps2A-Psr (LCP) family protein